MNPSLNEGPKVTYKEQGFLIQILVKLMPPKKFQNFHLKVVDAKALLMVQTNLLHGLNSFELQFFFKLFF